MSHEPLTPMNGVLGVVDLLHDMPLNIDQRADLRTVQQSGNDLLTVVSDILNYSKISTNGIRLRIFFSPFKHS
jgi:signal transduction histidine kinase